MYREVRDAQRDMDTVMTHLRLAFLAENTREANEHAGAAQAAVVHVKQRLQSLDDRGDGTGPRVDRRFCSAALTSLDKAFASAERVAMGATVGQMHDFLLEFKTYADYADAYLRAALGTDGA